MSDRPSLCLLPGLLCDATVWAPQVQAFARRAEVTVADLWGPDSFAAMARKVLDEIPGPLAVCGHSMGARVALEMWRLAPERIERLALLSTGFHGPRPQESAGRMGLVELAYREGMDAVAAAWLPPMLHPERRADPALIEPLTAMIRRATPETFEAQQRAGLGRPDAAGYLPRIACPALVLCGRDDAWSPPAQHEDMARRIPGAELVLVDRCGHMATVEQPDAINAALADWLDRPA